MKIVLTDEQIAKVLQLCGEIAAIRQEMPAAPAGFDVRLELARNLRASFERHNDTLLALGQLLQLPVATE